MCMYAMVQVAPGASGFVASVQKSKDEEMPDDKDVIEAWLRDQLQTILPYQRSRGGGLFVLAIPVALLD